MAAAVLVSVAVGIWVGASLIRNKVAWDSARRAKGSLDAAKKGRQASVLRLLWPIAAFVVLGVAIAGSPDQFTSEGGMSASAVCTLVIVAVLLGGWLFFRYAETSRIWKGISESKAGLSNARRRRWATLWPAVLAVVVLFGVVVALMTAQSG
jgi:hypothetical protein